MAITLAKPRLLVFNNMAVSDHNRSPLSVDIERIETATRMANGTMRKYVVADKRTLSTSWSDLPNAARFTVDGYAGANDLENFYNSNKGAFTVRVYYGDNTQDSFQVMFTDFSKSLSKRGAFDFYDVDLTMEEV